MPSQDLKDRLANFSKAIKGRADAFNTHEQALRMMQVINAFGNSATTGKPVSVEAG
jgi:hypothetical protein